MDAGDTWRPADEGRDRHCTWSVAVIPTHGSGNPQARIYRRADGRWRALAGGFPSPLPARPYALVATHGRVFAGLADG